MEQAGLSDTWSLTAKTHVHFTGLNMDQVSIINGPGYDKRYRMFFCQNLAHVASAKYYL